MKEKIAEIYENEVKTPMVGYCWKGLALFLLGMIMGFLLAPIKKGVNVGCDNGNNCSFSGNDVSLDNNSVGGDGTETDAE